jgi:hypothetical protein
MKLGTENRKKVWFLAALGLLAVYLLYSNVFSSQNTAGPPAEPESARTSAPALPGPEGASGQDASRTEAPGPKGTPTDSNRNASRGRNEEFHPVLHSKRPEDRLDPMTIDPILRLDLLAKVQGVELAGGSRNLFQYGPPPVKAAEALKGTEPKVVPQPVAPVLKTDDQPKAIAPPPPIGLKYYGFSTGRVNGKKTAFFLDGEEISVAAEGETVKKRYRVVRIGVNSVLVEDTESKRQQSLPLTEEQPS